MGCISSKQGSLDISAEKPGGQPGQAGPPPLWSVLRRQDYYQFHQGCKNKTTEQQPSPHPPLPSKDDAKTDEEKAVLHVEGVDLLTTENGRNHYTLNYEMMQPPTTGENNENGPLVVRRGDPFNIMLRFDREFSRESDSIRLVFEVGDNPSISKGTRVILNPAVDENKAKGWAAKITKIIDNSVKVRIYTPANLAVARWTLRLDVAVKKDEQESLFRYTNFATIYMLFNPWCQEDQVYLDDQTCRQEYVLNDKGRIYRGTKRQISVKPWNYGQFEDFVLDCCMDLLDASELSHRLRGNPIFVTQKIAMLINSPDDQGVLVGNWSGDYSEATSPLNWAGSTAILEQYHKTKQPVKYGQCWVFSAVITTVCRALGVPSRCVTNYASAHNCDGSMAIDVHWQSKGTPLYDHCQDSVWTFHVWNDVWMTRPDLPAGFGGWQAINATPQETSHGVTVTGPVSLEAVKSGLVQLSFNGSCLFSEVNADCVHWIEADNSNWEHVLQRYAIGKNISTKSPNNSDRMDITYMYKFNAGTNQERTAVWRAVKESSQRKDIYEVKDEDVKFEIVEKENSLIGQTLSVTLKTENTSSEERTLNAVVTSSAISYTGVLSQHIKTENVTIKLDPNTANTCTLVVRPEEYLDRLVDLAVIRVHCVTRVCQTDQWHCEVEDFRLIKPDLDIKLPSDVTVGDEFDAEISFTNPLSRSLTRCEFHMEGAGLLKPFKIKNASVAPGSEVSLTKRIKALKSGNREMFVSFDSKELSDVNGSASIFVTSASS